MSAASKPYRYGKPELSDVQNTPAAYFKMIEEWSL